QSQNRGFAIVRGTAASMPAQPAPAPTPPTPRPAATPAPVPQPAASVPVPGPQPNCSAGAVPLPAFEPNTQLVSGGWSHPCAFGSVINSCRFQGLRAVVVRGGLAY